MQTNPVHQDVQQQLSQTPQLLSITPAGAKHVAAIVDSMLRLLQMHSLLLEGMML